LYRRKQSNQPARTDIDIGIGQYIHPSANDYESIQESIADDHVPPSYDYTYDHVNPQVPTDIDVGQYIHPSTDPPGVYEIADDDLLTEDREGNPEVPRPYERIRTLIM